MEYRFLGNSGLKVSALSYGAWVTFANQADTKLATELMTTAYEYGVNFFDNAEVYASGEAEKIMGKVIKNVGWERSDLVISTKLFWGGDGPNDKGLSRKHILEGIDKSLKRLQLDYVDLVFCHRPDLYTPMEETVRAMNHIIQQGKAFYWGTSEWNARQIMEAYQISRRENLIPPLMEQPEYNMFHRFKIEVEFAPLYKEIGLGTTIWSPLASGLLTGKYNKGIPEGTRSTLEGYGWLKSRFESEQALERIAKVEQLTPITGKLGCTMAQLAIAWCLKNQNVSTVITGASKKNQMVENLEALDVVGLLNDEIMERIETILDNKPQGEKDWR